MTETEEKDKNKTLANTEEKNAKEKVQEAEILDNLPPDAKKIIEMGFSMQRISGPMPNPLMQKITEKHIDKILELTEKEDNNSFVDAQTTKKYSLTYFIIIILFCTFIIYYLVDKDKSLLMNIIEKAIFVLSGFGGGYGFKAYLDNKKKNK